MKKVLILTFIFGIFAVGLSFADTMKQYKGTKGRSYHSDIYATNCNTCHTDGAAVITNSACVECHGEIATIEIDETKLVMPKANPHKSVHYKNGASCLACHSEHTVKAPVCANCHRSWFGKM